MRKPSLWERGFTLIEVMISTGLLTLVLGSLVALLSDYSQMYREAQEKNVLMTLRRRVIQNLNRREAWIVTYRAEAAAFGCLLQKTNSCGTGEHNFTLYSGRDFPPTYRSIVFSTKNPNTNYTTQDANYGLTMRGDYCATFDEDGTSAGSLRCPIRFRLFWELLSFGVPSPTLPGIYYPTGYFPYGYFEGSGSNNYFAPGYFPGAGSSDYWWFGTMGAQIRVRGEFTVHDSLKSRIQTKNYDFAIIKEVP